MSVPLLYSWMVSVRGVIGTVLRMEGLRIGRVSIFFHFIPLFLYSLSFLLFFVFTYSRLSFGVGVPGSVLIWFIAREIILVSYSQTFVFESILPLYIPVYTFLHRRIKARCSLTQFLQFLFMYI